MKKMKTTWLCLKCKHKWVNDSKVDPRICPLCGSCTIYVPKIIEKQKQPNFSIKSPVKKESFDYIFEKVTKLKKEILEIVR